MRRWLNKVVPFILLILVALAGVEYYAITHDDSGLRKRVTWFKANADRIDGLILGPSLVEQGIDPGRLDRPTASLAMAGSAPDVDTKLLDIALDRSKPDFILFDLTLGTLERRKPPSFYSQRKLFHHLRVKHEGLGLKDYFMADYPLYRYFFREPDPQQPNELGWPTAADPSKDRFAKLGYDPDTIVNHPRTLSKLRNQGQSYDEFYNQNIADLDLAIARCRAEGVRLIFVAPPKYNLFNEHILPMHRERRAAFLDRVVDDETVFFWDYATFGEDDPRNFTNISHLSPLGATRWTEVLNERLNKFQ
ncbi:MAG: hypothetical protein AAF741_06685 [Bacteroidota bacterium]